MKDKDREIRIGENRLCFSEDNIICKTIVGDVDEKTAIAFWDASRQMRSKVEGKVKILIDLTRAGKPAAEARRIAQQELQHERIGKVAILGMHPVARVIASFVMGVSKKRDMRFFQIKEEALAWLKEG